MLLLGSLLQQPGRTTFDTKFDLTADPAAFLGRALHLWNPVTLGELQNQAYGYLFPQGPYFLAAQAVHLPDWLAQRLWSGLLLVVAYEGARRLCRSLGITGVAAVIGGLCYALSPRLLGAVGVLSGEVLPEAVLPWVVLPLVLGRRGHLSPRRAGLLSGVAVLCMSGVNATGTLAALPIALFVAASGLRRRGGGALLRWWLVGAALASAWWLGPLLLLGRYSPPFLDFIETAAATTFPTGWANSVRGAVHWVAFYEVHGRPWWPGAHELATSAPLAVLGSVVTAVGLVGLVHRRMPLRTPLVLSLVVGLACLTVANPSAVGSFVDEPVRALLDGPLAALRNVHKVDPLVRLPVAIGFAHATVLALRRLSRLLARRSAVRHLRTPRAVLTALLVTVLLAGAAPLLTGGLRTPGWTEVPRAWEQTADYLARQPGSRALVVPGAGFGIQRWGWTIDEPLQGVAQEPWVTRSQVPLIPGQTARVLDAVEQRLASGQGGAGLSAFLRRAGITHVVLRRDVDAAIAETAAPDRVERALLDSPGLRRTAAFGRTGFGDQPLIEVFEVPGATSRAALVAAQDVVTLDGGPEDLMTALDAGLLAPAAPVVVQSDPGGSDLMTDGYRRVERQFGRIHDAVGQVQTAAEPYREDRPAPDYPGASTVARATAEYLGVDDVRASSSQGYPDAFGPVLPALGPAAAFDGRTETAWRSAPLESPTGQWLDLDLDRPVAGGVLSVSFLDAPGTATVRRAAVSFDGESRLYGVPDGGRLLVPVPTSPVSDVRISVESVVPGVDERSPVGIAEVGLPGVPTGRTLDVPRPVGSSSTVLLTEAAPRRACVDVGYGPHCETSAIRTPEEDGLDRRLTMVGDGTWELSGTVAARADAATAALLAPVDAGTVSATSASVLGDDPSVSAVFAFDGRSDTPWLTDPAADQATLTLRWSGERTVSRLRVDPARVAADQPVRARIESSAGVRDVDLSDFGYFEPLRARGALAVTFYRGPASRNADLPLGVGEVRLDGMEGLRHQPSPDTRTGAVCGLGPELRIDDRTYRSEVTGTLADVVAGRPLTWRSCDGPVRLGAGDHRIVAEQTAQFQPVTLALRPGGADTGASRPASRMQVRSWGDERRVVSVSAGPAAVLRVPENVNPGWRATLDGERLEAVVLDGWQQGYRIPAGRGGNVLLEFAPGTSYRVALLAGLVLAVVLVALAAFGSRRSGARSRVPVGLTAAPRVLGVAGAIAVGLGALVLGGIPLAVGWLAGLLAPIRRYAVPLGVLAVVLSGVLAATSAGLATGRPGVAADTAAAVGIGLLLGQLVRVRRGRDAQREGRPMAEATPDTVGRHRDRDAVELRLRVDPMLLGGALLILLQTVVRAGIVLPSYYWQDDFHHVELARRLGLSQAFLVRDYSGHLEVGQYFLYWLIGRDAGLSFVPGALSLLGMQLAASCLLLAVLRQLFGRSPWVLVPFAGYLFTPLGLPVATWWAAGLQAMPLQITMLLTILALVRAVRQRSWRWAAVAVAAQALGLLLWEKAVLILPAALAVLVLVEWAGTPVAVRVRRLLAGWWLLLPLVLVLVGYAFVYTAVVDSSSVLGRPTHDVVRTTGETVIRMLLPGLFGGPWTDAGRESTVFPRIGDAAALLFAALLLAVVAASLWLRGRRALQGWLLAAGYVAADVVLLQVGRADFIGLLARDPRYVTDALPIIAIGVCAAFSGPARTRRIRAWLPRTAGSRGSAVPVVAVLTCSCLLSSVLLAEQLQHRSSRDYVQTLVQQLDANPGVSVLSTPLPTNVSVSTDLGGLLLAVGQPHELDQPGTDVRMLDRLANLRPVTVTDHSLEATGPVQDCGWRVEERWVSLGSLPERPGAQVVRLGYLTGQAATLYLEVGDYEQAVAVPSGVGHTTFVVTARHGTVRARVTDVAAGGICVTDVVAGAPWPAD